MLASMISGALTVRPGQVKGTLRSFVSCISAYATALCAVSLLTLPVAAQEDSLPVKAGAEAVQANSVSDKNDAKVAKEDSLPEKVGMEAIQLDHLPEKAGTEAVKNGSPGKESSTKTDQMNVVKEKAEVEKSELVNITKGNRRVRPYGWGEYRVPGTCLCCDNKNDGDCIVVHSIERTNRLRITQIIDGKIDGDTSNIRSYFGNLKKRDRPEHVTQLMVDIPLGKEYEITKVIVYTMIDKKKYTNFLSNCELGYYDQFNRLQWTGKKENKKYDEPITFAMENPVLTRKIMLRVKGGKNRITEVAIFSGNKTNEKP